jgi:hypothetical protein
MVGRVVGQVNNQHIQRSHLQQQIRQVDIHEIGLETTPPHWHQWCYYSFLPHQGNSYPQISSSQTIQGYPL